MIFIHDWVCVILASAFGVCGGRNHQKKFFLVIAPFAWNMSSYIRMLFVDELLKARLTLPLMLSAGRAGLARRS